MQAGAEVDHGLQILAQRPLGGFNAVRMNSTHLAGL